METFYVNVSYLYGRPARYEYASFTLKIENPIDSLAYANVLEKFAYAGICWLKRQGVTGPLVKRQMLIC